MNNFINTSIKGMLIGIANIIPGVSGGTMAFVLGIYNKLTEAIGYFLIRPEKRKEYFFFLCNIAFGIILGLLVFAKLISFLLGVNLPENSPVPFTYIPTFGFFLGLIIGSIPVLFRIQKDTKYSLPRLGSSLLGAIFLITLALLREPTNTLAEQSQILKDFGLFKIITLPLSRMIWLFIVGILAAFTMVIPGISGSALLVTLGEYAPILNYISERSLVPIAIIGMGAGLGIIIATLIISKLLEYRPGATFYFILGLIATSCGQIMFQMINTQASLLSWVISIPITIGGIYLALLSAMLSPN
ncbi:MAG: DUF368 domain-containing protein [Brevinema sp.]